MKLVCLGLGELLGDLLGADDDWLMVAPPARTLLGLLWGRPANALVK